MKTVIKDWGSELWIVNCEKYCAKVLNLAGGWSSSYHFHKEKQETFYCLEGEFVLNIAGADFAIKSGNEPTAIYSGTPHSFSSRVGARILEVSTEHNDQDVYRLDTSRKLGDING